MEMEEKYIAKFEELWRKRYLETKDLSDGWKGISKRIAVDFAEYMIEEERKKKVSSSLT